MRFKSLRTVVASVLTGAFCAMNGCGLTQSVGDGSGGANSDVVVDENVAVFSDPDSDYSTTDVREVDEQIVRFDTVARTMIWAETDVAFEGWDVNGNFLNTARSFQVRFGMVDGEQRAYFTETTTGTICDLEVPSGSLSIRATNTPVPQS